MRKLTVFNHVSLDGFFVDSHGEICSTHRDDDPEWQEFVQGNASGGGEFVFGRKTYEMMASYWPTPRALEDHPLVAKTMNGRPKVVFSRTLARADWSGTRLLKGGLAEEVRRLKQESGTGLVIFGSGTIVAQLTEARLIDEYQLVINPLVLGKGRTLFEGISARLELKLLKSRAFRNGNTVQTYAPGD